MAIGSKASFDYMDCYEFITKELQENPGVDRAVLKYSEINDLKPAAVRTAYYSVKRRLAEQETYPKANRKVVGKVIRPEYSEKPSIAAAGVSENLVPEEEDPADFLGVLTDIIHSGGQAGVDINKVFGGFVPLFRAAKENVALKKEVESLRNSDEVDSLKAELAELKKERDELKESQEDGGEYKEKYLALEKEYEKMKQDFDTFNETVMAFVSLNSMDKVAELRDFTSKLKVMVDKYGNVQQVEQVS